MGYWKGFDNQKILSFTVGYWRGCSKKHKNPLVYCGVLEGVSHKKSFSLLGATGGDLTENPLVYCGVLEGLSHKNPLVYCGVLYGHDVGGGGA